MTTFTSLTDLANNFHNDTVKELFISSFKNTVNEFQTRGCDFKTSNELAFEVLIRQGAFETALYKTYKA